MYGMPMMSIIFWSRVRYCVLCLRTHSVYRYWFNHVLVDYLFSSSLFTSSLDITSCFFWDAYDANFLFLFLRWGNSSICFGFQRWTSSLDEDSVIVPYVYEHILYIDNDLMKHRLNVCSLLAGLVFEVWRAPFCIGYICLCSYFGLSCIFLSTDPRKSGH